jgi:RNA polymerase sigma-70 factor (ECF subfamily)
MPLACFPSEIVWFSVFLRTAVGLGGSPHESGPAQTEGGKLAELYRAYGGAIFARCRRLLGDDAAAEDATQETFMRVYRHIAAAPDAREAVAWIYRIATNYCLNELRDRKRRPLAVETLPESASVEPEQALANVDLARQLMQRVPAKLRAPAWLYYVDGLDQEEVARVLGISRRTVVTRLGAFQESARKYLARSGVQP